MYPYLKYLFTLLLRGFFKRHRDFNSTTSNMIEEFSLIICVTPDDEAAKGVEGGETAIVTFGGVDAKPTEKVFEHPDSRMCSLV